MATPAWSIAWKRNERQASRHLRAPMREFLSLARFAHRFFEAGLALTDGHKVGEARRVQAQILTQLSLQLRIVEFAAEHGYAFQAAANVTAAYELTAAVGFIAEDSQRASAWLTHSDSRNSYPPAKKRPAAIRALLEIGGVPAADLDSSVAEWEERHEFYCMAKHGNPKLLRRYGISVSNSTITLHHGPTIGAGYNTLAQHALFRVAQLLVYSVPVFANPLYGAANQTNALHYVRQMKLAPKRLEAAALRLPQRNGAA